MIIQHAYFNEKTSSDKHFIKCLSKEYLLSYPKVVSSLAGRSMQHFFIFPKVLNFLRSLNRVYLYPNQGWGQLIEMHAVVCSCEARVCSCNRSCSCGCLKPSFAVVLAVVPGLKSPFVLAVAVVDDFCAAVVLAVVPSYDPSFAVLSSFTPG